MHTDAYLKAQGLAFDAYTPRVFLLRSMEPGSIASERSARRLYECTTTSS